MTKYYLGIDIGKYHHQAYICSGDGEELVGSFKFENSAAGYQKLEKHINKRINEKEYDLVLAGMEATGAYWLSLYSHLKKLGVPTVVLNPLQVNSYRNQGIRGNKTDSIDSVLITRVLRFGDYNASSIPSEDLFALRQLTRLRSDMVSDVSAIKIKIIALYDQVFPEYKKLFKNTFCNSSQRVMELAALPSEVANLSTKKLASVLDKASRGKLGTNKANQIKQAATNSIGVNIGLDAFSLSISLLLEQLKHFEKQIKKLNKKIETLFAKQQTTLTSIPGISTTLAASIRAEVGNFERFENDKNGAYKLVALAGLDPKLKQSGRYDGKVKMSKRGSPHLRAAVRQAAFVAVFTAKDPMFKAVYDKQVARGKHFEVALSHTSNKMLHVIYSLLKSSKEYQPHIQN